MTVVGGGFCGAIFAYHLLRLSPVPVRVELVEERARLGAGVAYSASGSHQTTNIPSPRMSVFPDRPADFEHWLEKHTEAGSRQANPYPNRFAFGTYMDELVRATVAAHPGSSLQHRRTRVETIERRRGELLVGTEDGAWAADAVALATGNPVPLPPPTLAFLAEDPRVVLDPWSPDALAGVKHADRVLVIGTGLSMGEAVAGLRANGHTGSIVAIARRGRRPERGLVDAVPPFGGFEAHRPATAVELLRHFRAEVQRAEAVGLSWRAVAVAARVHGWAIWSSLPPPERRRFVRHLRPYWEALRHVMPGPVHDLLQAEEDAGTLQVMAASIQDLEALPDGLYATLHRRGTPRAASLRERFDVVLNCTGPAYASLTRTDPFWAGLARAGLVRPDTVGLGIAVDHHGRALDDRNEPQPDLLVLGTLARGTFGELTGVAELSRQAREAAVALVESWKTAKSGNTGANVREAVH